MKLLVKPKSHWHKVLPVALPLLGLGACSTAQPPAEASVELAQTPLSGRSVPRSLQKAKPPEEGVKMQYGWTMEIRPGDRFSLHNPVQPKEGTNPAENAAFLGWRLKFLWP